MPPCPHTQDTNNDIDEKVEDLMMMCAVTTRAQAKKEQVKKEEILKSPSDFVGRQETDNVAMPPSDGFVGQSEYQLTNAKDQPIMLKDIYNAQRLDRDIAPIIQLMMQSDQYPDFRAVSGESLSVKALRQHWRCLFLRDGILYKKVEVQDRPTRVQLVLPRVYWDSVLRKLHNDPTAGHLGIAKTLERVKARFYWVGWRRTVTKHVSWCDTCNIRKRPHKRLRVPLTQQLFAEAFERVSIDLIGPLKKTSRGHVYAVTMEDNFTKWVEAAPLHSMETEEICDAIITHLVSRFGCMYLIHSDRGTQFRSEIFNKMCEKLGINKSITTAYNPKSNGLVENFNKVLKSMMKTYIEDHKESAGSWDVMLPYFLMAYRSSVHSSTGETPHFMVTSREMKMPIDLVYTGPSEAVTSLPSYVRQMEQRFNKAYAMVRERLKEVQRIQKKQYETGMPEYRTLQPGSTVWYLNPLKTFKGDKHQPWLGPYKVLKVNVDLTVSLDLGNGQTYKTHCDKVRLHYGKRAKVRPA